MAWLNFCLGVLGLTATVFSALAFGNLRVGEMPDYDYEHQEIVMALGSDGVFGSTQMKQWSVEQAEAVIAMKTAARNKSILIAQLRLNECPEISDVNPYSYLARDDVSPHCKNLWSDANEEPIKYSFSSEEAAEAWNSISRYKSDMVTWNLLRSQQRSLKSDMVQSAKLLGLYGFFSLFNYVVFGGFRFLPWLRVNCKLRPQG